MHDYDIAGTRLTLESRVPAFFRGRGQGYLSSAFGAGYSEGGVNTGFFLKDKEPTISRSMYAISLFCIIFAR